LAVSKATCDIPSMDLLVYIQSRLLRLHEPLFDFCVRYGLEYSDLVGDIFQYRQYFPITDPSVSP
jgi:hypothetical protein